MPVVMESNDEPVAVLDQLRKQLVVVALAIHDMNRADVRPEPTPDAADACGPAAAFFVGIVEALAPVRLHLARRIWPAYKRRERQYAQRRAHAFG
jgi:hypothetical protein